MKNETNELSPQESLDLISQMIRQTQGKVSDGSFYFLFWGWIITICNFGMYTIVTYTDSGQYAAWIWTLCIPAWIITMIYGSRQGRSGNVTTHLDKISMWLWIGLGITILPSWVFGEKINWMVNAIILMPTGLATFVSGIVIRFKPLLFGGVTLWVAGTLCYLVNPHEQFLVGGVAIIFGYLIPGYMLKRSKNK